MDFDKDHYVATNFGNFLPVPENSHPITNAQIESSDLPAIFELLDRMRSIPLKAGTGWGWFDAYGVARYGNWQAWVTKPQIMVKKTPEGDFYTWKEILSKPFVETAVIHQIMSMVNQSLKYIPSERYLVHGDFGPGNILMQDHKVTGIINWENALYGDFLYDVAFLDFWCPELKIKSFADQWYRHQRLDVPAFNERFQHHQSLVGLTALGVYAALDLPDAYRSVLSRLQH